MRKRPFSIEEFKQIYSKVPRLCVVFFIRNENGILLTLRKKHGWLGKWAIPGGTVLYKEPISDAIQRVAKEELGVQVTVGQQLGYIEYFSEEKERGFGYTIALMFLVTPLSGAFQMDEDAEEINFFTNLPENMVEEEREFITEHRLL